ncbi:sensor domain-containing protein [Mycobacterium sp. B14F4]|uniref:sensor domain-containing protein n=1 Tax=Mycobacterium sp. B14F4 TaxID=3153565 RepID=UPI00325EA08E
MNDGGYGGSGGRGGGDVFGADPYPEPPVISAPPPPRQEANTFATLSVVFAFVFAPVGAVLGHLGLSQIRRTGQRGRDRALIGLTLSYAFIVIVVVAVVAWAAMSIGSERSSTIASSPPPASTSTAEPDERLVTAAQLPQLLLGLDEVKQAVNAPALAEVEDARGLSGDQGINVNPRECINALFGGGASAYERGPSRAAFTRALSGDGQSGMILLNQTVSTFDSTAAATHFVSRMVGQWRGCAGRSVTLIVDGEPLVLDVGQPLENGTVIVLRNTLRGGVAGFSTDRTITSKANVVIDLDAQGYDLGESLPTIANRIVERVPN